METTSVNGKVYNVDMLVSTAHVLPIVVEPIERFKKWVGKGHTYWIDCDEKALGPYDILKDWDAAQRNPAWTDHVESIKQANLEKPIWVMRDSGYVFDGMHRLTRAFLDKKSHIKVRYFDRLPKEALLR